MDVFALGCDRVIMPRFHFVVDEKCADTLIKMLSIVLEHCLNHSYERKDLYKLC